MSKNIFYKFLFVLCIVVTYINIYELNFAVWFFTIILTLKKKYSYNLVLYLFPFLAILFIASFSSLFFDNNLYKVIRDITYLSKPILGIIVGYQLCRNYKINPFHTILYTGLFIASCHFCLIFYNSIVHKIINIHVLRGFSGFFSDFEVYALIIVIFHKEFKLNFSNKKAYLIILFIGLSTFLYLSRTNFIQLGIFYFVLKGYLSFTKKSIAILLLFISLILAGYAAIYNMNLSRNGKGLEALLFKIKNAPIEAFKTKIDKDDWQDFNDNYRSYENIIAVKQVSSSGFGAVLFGEGLGSQLNLTRKVFSNDGEFVQFIPYVHNGYMTVFLKSGLFGVFFMLFSIYIILKQGKTNNEMIKQINLLLIATGIYMIFVNWVLLGFFLKLDNKSIIIGFLLCYKEMLNRNENLVKAIE